jgi:hypothetical protein
MRHLLCSRCTSPDNAHAGTRYQPGRREEYKATPIEPAEWVRIVAGYAKAPTPQQRIAYVNGTPVPLKAGQFECDQCGEPITLGEPATAVTAWQPIRQPEPPYWEGEYLSDATPTAADLGPLKQREPAS